MKFKIILKSVFFICCSFNFFITEVKAACQAEQCGQHTSNPPRCGDGDCTSFVNPNYPNYAPENHGNCPIDCSAIASCGDGVISNGENCHNCSADVPFCDNPTTTTTCPDTTTTTTTCPPTTSTTTTTSSTSTSTSTTTVTTISTTTTTTSTTTTTIQNQCLFYKADVVMTYLQNVGYNTEAQTKAVIKSWQAAASSGPSCLQTEIDKTLAAGLKMVQALNACVGGFSTALRDDYALHMLLGKDMLGNVQNTLISKNLLNPGYCSYGQNAYYPPFTQKATCLQNSYVHGAPGTPKSLEFCAESVSYFDANCQAVDSSVATAACGTDFLGKISLMGHLSTPISFLWEKGADIEANISIVDFPLDPTKIGKKWLWKGSEKTPLLVYDPLHQGKITSATQLFGNWTFGGRRVASLIDSTAKQWNDGYEALKTLDNNGDGFLSGEELKTLALWFDKNSDSISSEGEVIDATSIGIKKIYFSPDKKDPITGNITASLGFEREVNGKIIKGSSVDWFSQGAEKKLELLLRQNNLNQSSKVKEVKKELQNKDTSYGTEFSPEDLSKRSGALTGVWKWKFENEHTKEALGNDGYFLINDDKVEGIRGYSMVETAFGDGKKVASAVLMYLIQGQKTLHNNEQEIKFSTEMGNGNTVSNFAKVRDDNKMLVGESTAVVQDRNGLKKTISYRWKASKYEPKINGTR